jgi:hypothetical protein
MKSHKKIQNREVMITFLDFFSLKETELHPESKQVHPPLVNNQTSSQDLMGSKLLYSHHMYMSTNSGEWDEEQNKDQVPDMVN